MPQMARLSAAQAQPTSASTATMWPSFEGLIAPLRAEFERLGVEFERLKVDNAALRECREENVTLRERGETAEAKCRRLENEIAQAGKTAEADFRRIEDENATLRERKQEAEAELQRLKDENAALRTHGFSPEVKASSTAPAVVATSVPRPSPEADLPEGHGAAAIVAPVASSREVAANRSPPPTAALPEEAVLPEQDTTAVAKAAVAASSRRRGGAFSSLRGGTETTKADAGKDEKGPRGGPVRAPPNQQQDNGASSVRPKVASGELFSAARADDESTLCRLLVARADPNATNDNGETPLFEAASYASLGAGAILLHCGADPNFVATSSDLLPADMASDPFFKQLLRAPPEDLQAVMLGGHSPSSLPAKLQRVLRAAGQKLEAARGGVPLPETQGESELPEAEARPWAKEHGFAGAIFGEALASGSIGDGDIKDLLGKIGSAKQPNADYAVGQEYEVIGTIMRKGENMDSPKIGRLEPGTTVEVLEIGQGPTGKRIRVRPTTGSILERGWISVVSSEGLELLKVKETPSLFGGTAGGGESSWIAGALSGAVAGAGDER